MEIKCHFWELSEFIFNPKIDYKFNEQKDIYKTKFFSLGAEKIEYETTYPHQAPNLSDLLWAMAHLLHSNRNIDELHGAFLEAP